MKFWVILVLCVAGVLGEKKINLEDIEKDNLQAEAQTEAEEAGYSSNKADSNTRSEYHTEARLDGQQPQEYKYVVQPEAYNQGLQAYQQQQQQAVSLLAAQQQQHQGPQQFYTTGYQTEALYQNQKNAPEISYQPQLDQGSAYQTEIPIGNQIQSYQQKIASQKFTQAITGKANQYTSGTQQLFYYPTQTTAKHQAQPLLHRLASEAAQNVQLPAYTPAVNHGSKITYQLQPQIQYVYEPQYVQPTIPTYVPKNTQNLEYESQQAYSGLAYSPQNSLYTQPKLSYTQAYYVQPQALQYYQRPAYTPAVGNSLSYAHPKQPFYVSSDLAQQLAAQISKHQSSHSFAQIPEEPRPHLSVPQLSAQNFKTGPVHSTLLYPNQEYSSGPKSLLDSYIPSHVIAAQDSERYRERPLHLESGFLPSRGSYGHSYSHSHSNNQKRKSE